MKKILLIIFMVLLILSGISFTSQAVTAGEKLATLGIIKGDAKGNLLEDESLSRAQMMVLLARLNSVEEVAENFDSEIIFRDVSADSYYAPFIAYAYKEGWTKGTDKEMFSPDAIVNRQMVATFMLRVLGYNVPWDAAIEEASKLGIVDNTSNEIFTRKNAFDMIYDAVNTKVANGNLLLGEKLDVGEDIFLLSVEALSNTKIQLNFSAPLDPDTIDSSRIEITNTSLSSGDLAIFDLQVNNSIVKLTTESMDAAVYLAKVKNIADIYDNPLDSENSSSIFFGKDPTNQIEEMTIRRINDTKIAVEFNENIDKRAANEKIYSIDDNLVELEKVQNATLKNQKSYTAVEDYKKTVILSIPKTKSGQVHTLTVAHGLVNIDGVETSEALTGNFIGAGIKNTLPRIESVTTLNDQTLKINFDRDVTDETVHSKIWNQKSNIILGPNILAVDTTGDKEIKDSEDLDLKAAAYAYKSNEDNNILIVRMNQPVFRSDGIIGTEKNFHLVVDEDYVYSDESANIFSFETNNQQVKNPKLERVIMLNEKTIEVYFNEPVQIKNKDEIKIYKASEDLKDNTLMTSIKNITSTDATTWTMSLENPIESSDVLSDIAYFYLPDGAAKDFTGTVDVMDANTKEKYQLLNFALNYEPAQGIKEVFVGMLDNRTIEVTYPEDMYVSDVINERNYMLLGMDSKGVLSELDTVDFKSAYSIYDEVSNSVRFYLDTPIINTSNVSEYYLAIDSSLNNFLETKTIDDKSTENLEGLPSKKGLLLEFDPVTNAPKKPILENIKVSDDRYSLTILFNEDIAFLEANNLFHPSKDLIEGLTVTEFLEAIEMRVQFESQEEISVVQSDTITSLSANGPSNEQSIKVSFNKKIAVNSIGKVTTEGKARNKIFNRKSAFAEVNSFASEVTFGVGEPLYSDGQSPRFILNESIGIDSDSDGRINEVVLVFDENMKLTQPIDTNTKAKTLITELVVDNGTEFTDLSETMTEVIAKDNKVIIKLEDSVIGTGIIKVSIDADTGNLYGQLQDTSILKTSDQRGVTLTDTVAPVLIKAKGTVGSEAVRLTFSESVSGGSPDIPEKIKVSDLNWTDISGDGTSFIKFILSSKNKANHGIVIDQDVSLNDLGKDTVSVVEDSIFDSSENPVLSGIQVVLVNK